MRADNSFAFAFNKIAPPENTSPEALRAYNSKVNRAFEEIYEKVMGHLDEKNLSPKTRKELDNKVESKELDKYTLLTQTDEKIALEASRVDGHLADFTVRADGIEAKAVAADGKAAQAQLTADGASTTASNAAGLASEAKQTAEAFSWRLALGAIEARISSEKNNPNFPDSYEYGLYLYSNGVYYGGMFVDSVLGDFSVGGYQRNTNIYGASITLTAGNGSAIALYHNELLTTGNLIPSRSGEYTVGSASYRYLKAYWVESASVSSDLRLKQNIAPLGEMDDEAGLLYRLKPIRYRLKSDPKKLHFGFGAQHVQEAIKGTSYEDAALLADEDPDHLGLCYEELIAVLVAGHQKHHSRIHGLELENQALAKANVEQQWEIDKLRADMTEALNRISALEARA